MAATTWIETETRRGFAPVHPHNGYWAGDFSVPREGDQRMESDTGRRELAG